MDALFILDICLVAYSTRYPLLAMIYFLIRIQLKHTEGKKSAIYGKLHSKLPEHKIYNRLQNPGDPGQWTELPRATYYTGAYGDKDAAFIRTLVLKIIKDSMAQLVAEGIQLSPRIEPHVIVAAATGQMPFATSFPRVDSPLA